MHPKLRLTGVPPSEDPTSDVAKSIGSHHSVFVFGSNTAGRHAKGAALFARQLRGAIYGQGEGLQGNSYAIPTKGQLADRRLVPLSLPQIRTHVERFLAFAASRPDLRFEVTPIG